MKPLSSTTDRYGGVTAAPDALPADPEAFRRKLLASLVSWKKEGVPLVWLEIPATKAALIPVAVEEGCVFHHCGEDSVTLTVRLGPDAFVPPQAGHYVGAGGVALNERGEVLVVWERADRTRRPHYYKLPGGTLRRGERIAEGVIREVREETGIRTRFEYLVCLRHWLGYRHGKSDIYFVCRLTPLTDEIRIQDREIEACLWMPVDAYLANEHVGVFNKRVVEVALEGGGLDPGWVEGYAVDPGTREIFFPRPTGEPRRAGNREGDEMAERDMGHNESCESTEHGKHLCFLMYEGFHLKNPQEYKAMVQTALYRCGRCGRTAKEARNLCEPVAL